MPLGSWEDSNAVLTAVGQKIVWRIEYLSRICALQFRGFTPARFAKWYAEEPSPLRRSIVVIVLLGALLFGWLLWRSSACSQQPKLAAAPTILKQPAVIATRTFDPDNLPTDMPPMVPGELAVTDSNFISDARVSADVLQLGATAAMVTVTQVTVTLQLTLTMWVPVNATQHVIEHEEGHRQISEYFYGNADKIAARIASTYIGKQIRVTGTDTHAEIGNLLQKLGADITEEYGKELNPDPTQLRYDEITDHSRNEVDAKDAVAQALKDAAITSTRLIMNPATDLLIGFRLTGY